MKTNVFLRRVHQHLKVVAPDFYMQCIHRQSRLLLKRAERGNQKHNGKSLGQVTDPSLRMIWAIYLCISDYITERMPQESELSGTVTGLGSSVSPFVALGMIRDGLQLAFFLLVIRELKIETNDSSIAVGPGWHLVQVHQATQAKVDRERGGILGRIDLLMQKIVLLEIFSSAMKRMLEANGFGDTEIPK